MLDWPLVHVFGGLMLLALVCAASSPQSHRREAMFLAGLLVLNWSLFLLSYTPHSPARALRDLGVPLTVTDIWAVTDGLCGVMALVAFEKWWGWCLWLAAIVQEVIHLSFRAGLFDQFYYTDRLTDVLILQLAIFFFLGGWGAWSRAADNVRHLGFRSTRRLEASTRARAGAVVGEARDTS